LHHLFVRRMTRYMSSHLATHQLPARHARAQTPIYASGYLAISRRQQPSTAHCPHGSSPCVHVHVHTSVYNPSRINRQPCSTSPVPAIHTTARICFRFARLPPTTAIFATPSFPSRAAEAPVGLPATCHQFPSHPASSIGLVRACPLNCWASHVGFVCLLPT
jgi:hypothetical protein